MAHKVYCTECADVVLTSEEIEMQKKNTRQGEWICYFCRCDAITEAICADDSGKELDIKLPSPQAYGRKAKDVKEIFAKRQQAVADEQEKEDLKNNPAKVPERLLQAASKKAVAPTVGQLISTDDTITKEDHTVIRHELEPGNYIELSIKYPVPPAIKEGMELALKQLWEDAVTATFAFKTDSNMVLNAISKAKDEFRVGFQQPTPKNKEIN